MTRTGRIDETHGPGLALAVTVDGWAVRRLIAAVPQIPWAVKAGTRQAHAPLDPRVGPPGAGEVGRPCPPAHGRRGERRVMARIGGRDHHRWDVRGRPKRPWR